MTLAEYLSRNPAQKLADDTGLSVASLSRMRREKQRPSMETMQKLFDATGGLVTPNDFLGIAA
jgi:transcriptional regulator with XRE-family HTH domain